MLPGPMRNGCPQAPSNVGMSVVKATMVVGRPSNLLNWIAGVCSTSRASARPAICRGLAIDKKARAARRCRGCSGPRAVAFFADNEEQSEIARARGQKFLRRSDHRGDDALGIAGTAAPDEIAVLA